MKRTAAVPALLALAGAVALLTGCQATVGTTVAVGSDARADVSVSVRFDGAVADELRERPGLVEALDDAFAGRGLRAERHSDGESEIWMVELGTLDPVPGGDSVPTGDVAAAIAASADVTGVSIIAVERRDSEALVKVVLSEPDGLRQALLDAIGDAPDAGVLYETYAANTSNVVAISFPGDVVDAGEMTATGAGRVVLTRPLDAPHEGAYSVLGSLDGGTPWRTFVGIGAVLVAAATGLVLTRSRR